jgi:hypothetical protein
MPSDSAEQRLMNVLSAQCLFGFFSVVPSPGLSTLRLINPGIVLRTPDIIARSFPALAPTSPTCRDIPLAYHITSRDITRYGYLTISSPVVYFFLHRV